MLLFDVNKFCICSFIWQLCIYLSEILPFQRQTFSYFQFLVIFFLIQKSKPHVYCTRKPNCVTFRPIDYPLDCSKNIALCYGQPILFPYEKLYIKMHFSIVDPKFKNKFNTFRRRVVIWSIQFSWIMQTILNK